jgi:hypothetical protein
LFWWKNSEDLFRRAFNLKFSKNDILSLLVYIVLIQGHATIKRVCFGHILSRLSL